MKTIKNVHCGLYESTDKYGVLRPWPGVSWGKKCFKKRSRENLYSKLKIRKISKAIFMSYFYIGNLNRAYIQYTC